MLRAIAATLVALLTSAAVAPVTCVGWEGSAASRRACCQRAERHQCPDQRQADDCCAGHERTRHATPALASSVQAPPLTIVSLPVPAFDMAAIVGATSTLVEMLFADRLHGPPITLFSPLRI